MAQGVKRHFMMNNKEIMLCLRRLKDEGINYKYIADQCEIPVEHFYKYTYKRSFPISAKEQIEAYLFSNFKDIVYEECFSFTRRD